MGWSEIMVSLEEARITCWKTSDGINRILRSRDAAIETNASSYGLFPTVHLHGSILDKISEGYFQQGHIAGKLNWEVVSTTLVDNFKDPHPTIVLRLRDSRK